MRHLNGKIRELESIQKNSYMGFQILGKVGIHKWKNLCIDSNLMENQEKRLKNGISHKKNLDRNPITQNPENPHMKKARDPNQETSNKIPLGKKWKFFC